MKIFHRREEHHESVLITFYNWPTHAVLASLVAAAITNDWFDNDPTLRGGSSVFFGIAFVLILWRRIEAWRAYSEIGDAMRNGAVEVAGSALDPRGFRTFRIRKTTS